MKISNPSVEIISQEDGIIGVLKQIEKAGRVCYKSEDKITDNSYIEFVDRLIKSKHYAMLEHGTVYLYYKWDPDNYKEFSKLRVKYISNKYSKVIEIDTFPHGIYITTNYRVIIENDWQDDLKYICEPTEFHEKRVTALFNTQIAITREYNRHRVNSIAESSTRYCNYSKDKFNEEITISRPEFISNREIEDYNASFEDLKIEYFSVSNVGLSKDNWSFLEWWLFAHYICEESYMNMIKCGCTPQQARTVLNLDTKSELIHTASISDWQHFLDLRTANSAHPDARILAIDLERKLKKLNYL